MGKNELRFIRIHDRARGRKLYRAIVDVSLHDRRAVKRLFRTATDAMSYSERVRERYARLKAVRDAAPATVSLP